ncbi:MAG: hypothetical protein MUF34_20120 [Polyangiaceae bacterium]|jgi:hypothetical protein|nr:hypothetical protein [Polyangiaceae bacterium]
MPVGLVMGETLGMPADYESAGIRFSGGAGDLRPGRAPSDFGRWPGFGLGQLKGVGAVNELEPVIPREAELSPARRLAVGIRSAVAQNPAEHRLWCHANGLGDRRGAVFASEGEQS